MELPKLGLVAISCTAPYDASKTIGVLSPPDVFEIAIAKVRCNSVKVTLINVRSAVLLYVAFANVK